MAIPDHIRKKLGSLRAEFAARVVQESVQAWGRLHIETRTILLLLAGIDGEGVHELDMLARRDWREFTPPERDAIKAAADALRWELNGVRSLPTV